MKKKTIQLFLAGSIVLCLSGCKSSGQQELSSQTPVIPLIEEPAKTEETELSASANSVTDTDIGRYEDLTMSVTADISDNTDISNNIEGTDNAASVEMVSTQLSEAELASFSDYFNAEEVNGFLKTAYELPTDIELGTLLSGIGQTKEALSEKEYAKAVKLLKQASGAASLKEDSIQKEDVKKYPAAYVEELLHTYIGLGLSDIAQTPGCPYSSTYDAYYMIRGDSGTQEITCTAGSVDSSGLYSIFYKKAGDDSLWNVILREREGSRLFHSNTNISGK